MGITIISEAYGRDKTGKKLWNCICHCGKGIVLNTSRAKRNNSCGCLCKNTFKDKTNCEINGIRFLKLIGKNKYSCWEYELQCFCGKIFISEGNDISSGKIKSCGCKRITESKKRKVSLEYSLINSIYRDYKEKAKRRSLFFELSLEQFTNLIFLNCYYCGEEPKNVKRFKKEDNGHILYNGIDRLNNNIGYTLENSKSCCRICNQAKHAMTPDYFNNWIERIISNKEQKRGFWYGYKEKT